MIREGASDGRIDLVGGTPEVEAFCDLVDYANRRRPAHPSLVRVS